jgi:hypothetical protein
MKTVRLAIFVTLVARAAFAWHCTGHEVIAQAALEIAADSLPEFMTDSKQTIREFSCEPDLFKLKENTNLRSSEGAEHYFDHELLAGKKLPNTRHEYVALCSGIKTDPFAAGFLPYAVVEWTDRLALAFAKHRNRPENADIKKSCAIYAGILSHYAADMHQPLHLTIHYDGRVGKPGTGAPVKGIHNKTDALVDSLNVLTVAEGAVPAVIDSTVIRSVAAQIDRGIMLIDSVYNLESIMPDTVSGPGGALSYKNASAKKKVEAFAMERAREAASFLAGLYVVAWKKSQNIKIPAWAGQ